MKIITLEEQFQTKEINDATRRFAEQFIAPQDPWSQSTAASTSLDSLIFDLGEERLRQMDAMGVDMQILSTAGVQSLPAAEAIPLARDANEQLAAAIKAYPDRLAGFATLPTPDPEAAAAELERAVRQLGLKGAMILGRTGERFLDDPSFLPLLAVAEALEVPIYLHPNVPPKAVQDAYYAGLDPMVSMRLATAGWGWHMEAGIHAWRMILSGVFDRFPRLQVILGHWGEMIPFYLARTEQIISQAPATKALQRRLSDYFVEQFYVTPSGLFTLPPFQLCLQIVGADRIMYSVDYPIMAGAPARSFLEHARLIRRRSRMGMQSGCSRCRMQADERR